MDAAPRILVSHASPEAYAPMARALMAKLGYEIVLPEEFEAIAEANDLERPAVRIVDERQLAEVPDEFDPAPIVVLSGEHGVTGADPRIVGAVRRPAGMHELYRLVQQVTEDTPRSTPRVPTHLAARCSGDGRAWRATMLSLSESGCLVRSSEPVNLGSLIELEFELPRSGGMRLRAEAAYQLLPDIGLIFHGLDPEHRDAISDFVTLTLRP